MNIQQTIDLIPAALKAISEKQDKHTKFDSMKDYMASALIALDYADDNLAILDDKSFNLNDLFIHEDCAIDCFFSRKNITVNSTSHNREYKDFRETIKTLLDFVIETKTLVDPDKYRFEKKEWRYINDGGCAKNIEFHMDLISIKDKSCVVSTVATPTTESQKYIIDLEFVEQRMLTEKDFDITRCLHDMMALTQSANVDVLVTYVNTYIKSQNEKVSLRKIDNGVAVVRIGKNDLAIDLDVWNKQQDKALYLLGETGLTEVDDPKIDRAYFLLNCACLNKD